MRLICFILLIGSVLSGCNSDPRCRRETALLRAEILDLEDKLALTTTRPRTTQRRLARADESNIEIYDGYSSSEQILFESGEIYEDGQILCDNCTIETSGNGSLEVQHQIHRIAPGEPYRDNGILPVEISPDLESIRPERIRDSILTEPATETLPAPDTSKLVPEAPTFDVGSIELVLDELESETDSDNRPQNSPPPLITQIAVNRDGSHGQNVDGKLGDEGLNLLIQPRTADGSIVLEPGKLVIELVDPSLRTSKRKVGRWSFTPDETELFFARDRSEGDGILLHLPWDQNPPANRELVVSIRFTTSDGRLLKTSSQLLIDPPAANYSADDPQIAGWTQRDSRWTIGSDRKTVATETDRVEKRRIKALPVSSSKTVTSPSRWRPVR